MATISPAVSLVSDVPLLQWLGVSTADTMTQHQLEFQTGVLASVQMTGTWGSATVTLQGSNDGTTWFTLKDVTGASISATANAYFEFATAAMYIKPASSGGTADNVDVKIVIRGPAAYA